MRTIFYKQWTAILLVLVLLAGCLSGFACLAEETQTQPQIRLVLTLGADLSKDQRKNVVKYFGITEDQAKVITITNADEHEQLGHLLSEKTIGTRTLSCALIRLTNSGGIQVKTANMNYVTSNMIASTLSTSGVYNCEVLTAAPFEVSGTGALTGVMMAYEAGTGMALDPEKKNLANEELVITGEIASTVGKDQATLVVNDIKIHIVRDGITDKQEVKSVVDSVIATTEAAAAEAAQAQGKAAPTKLGAVETEQLYDFGYKFSQIGYSYSDMQPTLERVTHNITKTTGIKDPIVDTFETIDDDEGLSIDSILLNTQDSVLGKDAIISATDSVALGDHPAEIIDVYTGDVRLTEAGKIKAESFISTTNVLPFKDVNGKYALMDLNGNVLTDSIFSDYFRGRYGNIRATVKDTGYEGVLNAAGDAVIPFEYDVVEVISKMWGFGIRLVPGTDADYDYSGSGQKWCIGTADVFYFGNTNGVPVGTLTRADYESAYALGEYLTIRNRAKLCTTYDSMFTPVNNPDSLYDATYNEAYRAAEILAKQTKYNVGSFKGNYAYFSTRNGTGIMDRYGNVIVPDNFRSFMYSMDDESYVSGGYFCARIDDRCVYVTQGGTITGDFMVSYNDLYNFGMAGRVKKDDGSYVLYAGDGVVSDLGTKYSYIDMLDGSKGLLWECQLPGYEYELVDWHGNVLLSGADNYSISANGNYIIAADGYTSNTLYLVNDASPVSIADTAGGAAELEVVSVAGASLEPYTGNPTIAPLVETPSTYFIDGTYLTMSATDDYRYHIRDLAGNLMNADAFDYVEYDNGWLEVQKEENGTTHYGMLALNGAQVLPCEYDHLNILNENWAVAYKFVGGATEADYDFKNYSDGTYYFIDKAVVCHLSETEVSSVTLNRSQIAGIAAEEDYLNVQDRTSGAVTTYDNTFTALATVRSIYTFDGFSTSDVRYKQIRDKTGLSVNDENFPDGYSRASIYLKDSSKMGVIDMEGNVVVPANFDRVENNYSNTSHVWANGYFCVSNGDTFGYVTEGGQVTCPIQYSREYYDNAGMSAKIKNADGTYSLIAADGTVTGSYTSLSSLYGGFGMFWRCTNANYNYDVIDWHGNVVYTDANRVAVSHDGKYLLIQPDNSRTAIVYGVDGAVLPEGMVAAQAAPSTAQGTENLSVPANEPAPTAAPATPAPTEVPAAPAVTEAPAAPAAPASGNAAAALNLIISAESLILVDASANRVAVQTLLTQAKTMIAAEAPAAAALIDSALMLLAVEGADPTALGTLLATAKTMLG